MIKNTILICTAVSLFSCVIGILLKASCGERIAKTLQVICDIFVLYIIASSILGAEIPEIELPLVDNSVNFESIEQEALERVVRQAELLLEDEVSKTIASKTGSAPNRCIAKIDEESFELKSLILYFESKDFTVSGYQVKKILSDRYNVNAEVVFE